MYLPDTNIFIKAFEKDKICEKFIEKIIGRSEIVISAIVMAEFLVKADVIRKEKFEELISKFGILAIDEQTARIAVIYRLQSLQKTKKVFLLDCFLAAQTKQHNLTLVTTNKSDFPMKDIRIISPK